jgi:hypothetical protein
MDLFVNELSLHGQFSSLAPFVAALKEAIGCRSVAEHYRHPFYCLRAIAECEALPGATFKEAVRQTHDVNLIRVVMGWLDKHGPFWEDARTHGVCEYFECANNVVTDCSLGEATFRMAQERATATISFRESLFCLSPLRVVWYRSDDTQDAFDLPNFWERSALEAYLTERETAPQSWPELIQQARTHYTELTFINSILDPLSGEPFNATIAERIMVLLGILNRLKGCFERGTPLSTEGHQLIQDFFHGDRALFSDESNTNKRTFTKQLTFVTPAGEEIFCPYHGKISFRYYRIHHSWPVVPDQPLYIAYIGPKITKS